MKKRRKLRILPVFSLLLFTIALVALAIFIIVKTNKGGNLPTKYSDIVSKVSVEEGVPKEVIYSVIYTESHFRREAVSNMGAVGLMQLLPDTAKWLCDREGVEYDESLLTDPEFNIRYGTRYLKILYDRYGNWDAAHAAYHAGFSRLDGWLEDGRVYYDANGELQDIPIESTKNYVNKLRDLREKYSKQLEKKEKSDD